ncbi:MAG TPA: 4'-phosphopantetheinyl transferase superfamily protein [Porticoccus sp.]|nr:4'-phosphopantetheinyl transferase superfamily protein [Porticoccus sp.]
MLQPSFQIKDVSRFEALKLRGRILSSSDKTLLKQLEFSLAPDLMLYWQVYHAAEETLQQGNQFGIHLPDSLTKAALSRRCDYLIGRYCAQQAIAKLCGFPQQVQQQNNGAPVWPGGLIGSITHSDGLALAIVGKHAHWDWLGIDVEALVSKDESLSMMPVIMNEEEHKIITAAINAQDYAFTLVFSAKKSIYKALYPKVRSFFDFHDVSLLACDGNKQLLQFSLSHSLAQKVSARLINVNYQLIGKQVVTWSLRQQPKLRQKQ